MTRGESMRTKRPRTIRLTPSRRWIALLIVAVIVGPLLPGPSLAVRAAGAPTLYGRTSITLHGVSVRTRGFLQDNCIAITDYPCYTFSDASYKPEGTAQARALQQLARLNDRAPAPLTNASLSRVQWEVGPDDGTWGSDGPPDSNDPDCRNTGNWRIDLVAQDASGALFAYEVKAWSVGRAAPRAQLNCYISRAAAAGIPLAQGSQLTGWVRTYSDKVGNTYCAWGDQPDPSDVNAGPGLVFFSSIADPTIPDFVRQNPTGGCGAPTDPLPARCARMLRQPTCVPDAVGAVALLLVLLALQDAGKAPVTKPRPPVPGGVTLTPFAQITGDQLHVEWSVAVQPLPTQPITLLLDAGLPGDYLVETVPAGTTPFRDVIFDDLPAGYGVAVQHAMVLETGQEDTGITAQDSNSLPPELFGLPDAVQCPQGQHTIAVSLTHGLAIGSGEPWSWGDNSSRELGRTGATTGSPAKVAGLHSVLSVAAGDHFSLALRSDGTLWAWGANRGGQLGNGTATSQDVSFATAQYAGPTLVGVLPASSASASNGLTGSALGSDGRAWVWGNVGSGLAGDGNAVATVLQSTPQRVPLTAPAVSLAIDREHGLAIDVSGEAWGWGIASGVTGSSRTDVLPPTAMTGGAASAAPYYYSSAIVMADGSIQTAGYDFVDQLGRLSNGITSPLAPVVSQPGPAVAISEMDGSTPMAVLRDGTLATWGDNSSGTAGIGSLNPDAVFAPTSVPGLSGVTDVASGFGSVLALRGDGSVLSWGNNTDGQLGNGQTGVRANATPAPVQMSGVDQPIGCGSAMLAGATAPAHRLSGSGRPSASIRFPSAESQWLTASLPLRSRALTANATRHSRVHSRRVRQ